ncbi:Cactin [Zea mays]|uniref:Cactin n=1 Tax=Zea mays TaxID=4577 RepID=A0A1D6FM73_MAIZE|nr:Cactin [Zea mays]
MVMRSLPEKPSKTLLARERARVEFQDWEKKEEEFHFDQSKVRSEIRLREGRTKPIDVLLKNHLLILI